MTLQPHVGAHLVPSAAPIEVVGHEPWDAVPEAAQELARGGLVVLHDDRSDQGDLIAAGELISPEVVSIMVRRGGGLVSVALTPQRALRLGLQPMAQRNSEDRRSCGRTPSMVSVESRDGVSTGISAADRARTTFVLADPGSAPHDLVSPGHVFPIVAAEGGLLERYGRLEAAVDAVRLAGCEPVAALCDVLDANGDLASGSVLVALATDLGIPFVTIGELVEARFEEAWNRS